MMTLVLGGSKSGKSGYAENLLQQSGVTDRIYLATMQPEGEEALQAIARHRHLRQGKGFITVEKTRQVAALPPGDYRPENSGLLLECMGNLCANEMFAGSEFVMDAADRILADIRTLKQQWAELIVVSNIVGEDGIRYDEMTMAYVRNIGLINRGLAKMADHVAELVYGIPVIHK